MEDLFKYVKDYHSKSENRNLARLLGINTNELSLLKYKLQIDDSTFPSKYHMKFTSNSPIEIIQKIKNIKDNSLSFELWELNEDFDNNEIYDAIIETKNPLKKFSDEIEKIEKLNYIYIENKELENILKKQLFISVIGLMEVFLSETFIKLVNKNDKYFRNFIETHPDFKKRKIELSEIYLENEKLKETAKKIMLDTIYHNLPSISKMYSNTFKINFPSIKIIYPFVINRHDFVHRYGKNKENIEIKINNRTVSNLITEVTVFIHEIAEKVELT